MTYIDRLICAANAAQLAGFDHLATALVEMAKKIQRETK